MNFYIEPMAAKALNTKAGYVASGHYMGAEESKKWHQTPVGQLTILTIAVAVPVILFMTYGKRRKFEAPYAD